MFMCIPPVPGVMRKKRVQCSRFGKVEPCGDGRRHYGFQEIGLDEIRGGLLNPFQ